MANAFFTPPLAENEPVLSYAPGTQEREDLIAAVKELKSKQIDAPMVIGGKEIRTGNTVSMHPPYEHAHNLGNFHMGTGEHVNQAIDAAMAAREKWANTPWQDRAAIFLKCAELLAGPFRAKMNAATMLCQSKNAFSS